LELSTLALQMPAPEHDKIFPHRARHLFLSIQNRPILFSLSCTQHPIHVHISLPPCTAIYQHGSLALIPSSTAASFYSYTTHPFTRLQRHQLDTLCWAINISTDTFCIFLFPPLSFLFSSPVSPLFPCYIPARWLSMPFPLFTVKRPKKILLLPRGLHYKVFWARFDYFILFPSFFFFFFLFLMALGREI
jgi:hypothetical protein